MTEFSRIAQELSVQGPACRSAEGGGFRYLKATSAADSNESSRLEGSTIQKQNEPPIFAILELGEIRKFSKKKNFDMFWKFQPIDSIFR